MTDQERFREFLERASRIVSKWPEWKRNILRDSQKPRRDTPRKPVINDKSS